MENEEIPGRFDLTAARLACHFVYYESTLADSDFSSDFSLLLANLKDTKTNPHASSYIVVRSIAQPSVVFLVFRGTQDLKDTIADFNCQPREIDDSDPSFFVHGGIYETSKQSMKNIFPLLNEANKQIQIKDLVLTGHSLGGACAMAARLFTLQMKQRGLAFSPNCHIVTFGAPLFFSLSGSANALLEWDAREAAIDEAFKSEILMTVHNETRCYVHENDLVPRILGKKKQRPGQEHKSPWEEFLKKDFEIGLLSTSVELLPGASASAAGVAGTGAIILSPAVATAVLAAIFVPMIAIPGLLLTVPMMATTKALPPSSPQGTAASLSADGKAASSTPSDAAVPGTEPAPESDASKEAPASAPAPAPAAPAKSEPAKSELESTCENVLFHSLSWAMLSFKGHEMLESEQLTGYFPLGTFFFLRGNRCIAAEAPKQLDQQEAGLDVPSDLSVTVKSCISDHGSAYYLGKIRDLSMSVASSSSPPPKDPLSPTNIDDNSGLTLK